MLFNMEAKIHLHILASGSRGNACIVEGPEGSVLIDCGISRRELFSRADTLGVDVSRVQALLLTHEHSDHVAGVTVLCNHDEFGLYATAGTIAARNYLSNLPFNLVEAGDTIGIAGMAVRIFHTSHDVADPVGFRFECSGDALGYCTDTGMLTSEAYESLAGCRILALESNHDIGMLEHGPYPAFLKSRVRSKGGHLSNDQAAEALSELVTDDTEAIVAMHISEKNNRPSIAVRALAKAVGAEAANSTFTEARTPDGHLSICAAAQARPLSVW